MWHGTYDRMDQKMSENFLTNFYFNCTYYDTLWLIDIRFVDLSNGQKRFCLPGDEIKM